MEEQIDCIKTIKDKFSRFHSIKQNKNILRIFYFPFTGQAQPLRLLCEYIKFPYQDFLLTPCTVKEYKKQFQENDIDFELPFIKHFNEDEKKDIYITGVVSMCLYIIDISKRQDMIGKNTADKCQVDMFLWSFSSIITMISIFLKGMSQEQQYQYKTNAWAKHYQKRFNQFQQKAKPQSFYLGYITVIDFYLYVFIHYLSFIFPDKIANYPKLLAICSKFEQLQEIKEYYKSDCCIKQQCPKQFFKQFKRLCDYWKTKKCYLGNNNNCNQSSSCQQ